MHKARFSPPKTLPDTPRSPLGELKPNLQRTGLENHSVSNFSTTLTTRERTYLYLRRLPVLHKPIMCSRYMVMKLSGCRPRQIEFGSGDKLFSLRPPLNGPLRQFASFALLGPSDRINPIHSAKRPATVLDGVVVAEWQKVPTVFYNLFRSCGVGRLHGFQKTRDDADIPTIRPCRSVVVNCVKTSTSDITVASQTSRNESNYKRFTV